MGSLPYWNCELWLLSFICKASLNETLPSTTHSIISSTHQIGRLITQAMTIIVLIALRN